MRSTDEDEAAVVTEEPEKVLDAIDREFYLEGVGD